MKVSAYILVAIVVFFGFLVVFAPVSPVWSMVKDDVSKSIPGLKVLRIGGSIWSGRSEIQFREFPASRVTWTISPFELLKGAVSIKATAIGDGQSLHTSMYLTRSKSSLEAHQGEFGADFINSVSEQYGVTFSGGLSIAETLISANKDGIMDASGSAYWSGGRIMIANNDQPFDLPPLDGILSFDEQLLILDVSHQQLSVLRITLNKIGWASIAIKGRFFDIANLARPEGTGVDETILLLEEKIL